MAPTGERGELLGRKGVKYWTGWGKVGAELMAARGGNCAPIVAGAAAGLTGLTGCWSKAGGTIPATVAGVYGSKGDLTWVKAVFGPGS